MIFRYSLRELSDKAWDVYNKQGNPKRGMEEVVKVLVPHIALGEEFLRFLETHNNAKTTSHISRRAVLNRFKEILGREV
jgi:hypothetical protein